jgi:hypothetical protein
LGIKSPGHRSGKENGRLIYSRRNLRRDSRYVPSAFLSSTIASPPPFAPEGSGVIQAVVQEITGVKMLSVHHDVSTVTAEAFIVLTLAEPPSYRQAKKT